MPLLRERRKPSKIYGLSAKSDEKLLCQLHAAKQLQVNNKLTYSQLHYLLADKSIPIPKIKYHLLRIHN